jgi:fructosamine-3-kinase
MYNIHAIYFYDTGVCTIFRRMRKNTKTHIENALVESGIPGDFQWRSVGGGSINNTYILESDKEKYFVKTNKKKVFPNGFQEEAEGLKFLDEKGAKVPGVVISGTCSEDVFLVLNWVASHRETETFWFGFGKQLAELHRNSNALFGYEKDNYMGQLDQNNTFKDDFTTFFVENRLVPQVKLARDGNLLSSTHLKHFEVFYKTLDRLIPKELPAALHGDLWSGNFISGPNQEAYLIDPAVYYGHREIDLAMTTIFGGFSYQFYQSYEDQFPLEPGFQHRKDYFNLYPLLIHLNLFGRSYLGSILRIVSRF